MAKRPRKRAAIMPPSDLDKAAAVTPEDIERARALWRADAPSGDRQMLDAPPTEP